MKPLVSISVKVYRLAIRLFPDEIRWRWEPEMADTFALQLVDALREARWSAIAGVWYYAAVELFSIALPARLARAAMLVPMAALAGAGAIFYGLLWVLQNPLTLNRLYHHTILRFGG
jgi:hypothetical protein